ncbi:MAG TPA: thioredoxin family protein [Opitutaceae bacterium]
MKRLLFVVLVFVLVAGAACGGVKKSEKGAHPVRISRGDRVDITEWLVPGKVTIFDFTSEYCPPCRMIAPHLEALHGRREDIAVVAVDINRPDVKGIDWSSPVARQYELRSIPHFKVFDGEGRLIAEGDQAREMVVKWMSE